VRSLGGNVGRGSVLLTRRHFLRPRRSLVLATTIASWFNWPELWGLNHLRGIRRLTPFGPVLFFLFWFQSGCTIPDGKLSAGKFFLEFFDKHIFTELKSYGYGHVCQVTTSARYSMPNAVEDQFKGVACNGTNGIGD
jgi:hypothetical protein